MGVVDDDPKVEHVTAEDLKKVFGIETKAPVTFTKTKPVEVERFSGVKRQAPIIFTATPTTSRPRLLPPRGRSECCLEPVVTAAATSPADGNAGFSPPPVPKTPGCPTCGKKKP